MASSKSKKPVDDATKDQIWEAFCDVIENDLYLEWSEELTEEDCNDSDWDDSDEDTMKIDRFILAGLTVKRLLVIHPESSLALIDRRSQLTIVERLFAFADLPGDFSGELSNVYLIDWQGSIDDAMDNWAKFKTE